MYAFSAYTCELFSLKAIFLLKCYEYLLYNQIHVEACFDLFLNESQTKKKQNNRLYLKIKKANISEIDAYTFIILMKV
jgi:hypothetical protein